MKGKELLSGAAKSASYNMILQVTLRVLTFVLNAFIVRHLSRDMLGVANVRLALLSSTGLFVSRECFRRACLNKAPGTSWRQVINVTWCVVPVAVFWSSIFTVIWLYLLERPDAENFPQYTSAVLCYALSVVVDVVAEPLLVMGQCLMFVRLKVIMEGVYHLVRCVTILILVVTTPQIGLYIFCIGQLASTFVYTAGYYGFFVYYMKSRRKKDDNFPFQTPSDLLPKKIPGESALDWSLAALSWSFFKQSCLKQILTEGERYVMTIFDVLSFADQGMYDVVNNLGSMAARFMFLPIEESGYLYFSKALHRGVEAKQQTKESIELASTVLKLLLKVVMLLGVTVMVFGYPFSHLALDLYGGKTLSTGSGPVLLRWHAVYVSIIAINGVTECFVFAAMSQRDVDRYNSKMLFFSIIFLMSSWYLTRLLGSVGFILANCLNMSARIIHSLYFIVSYYKGTDYRPLTGLIPSPALIVVWLITIVATVISEATFCCDRGILGRLLHIGVGGTCLLVELGTIYLTEKDLVQFFKDQFLSKSKDKQDKAD